MRLVHSFSSIYCDNNALFRHLSYFILSCLYAKRSGFKIVVHCDERAKQILQLAPYDDIITDLEGIPAPANDKIYAWSKFKAMENEDLGNIHIDGDVFLKSPILQKILEFENYDCIVQCTENVGIYGGNQYPMWKANSQIFETMQYPEWAKRECESMFNCGVVGFNNPKLKQEYFETYQNMLTQYVQSGIYVKNSVPDIIVEQQFLKDLTDYKNYKVKHVLPVKNSTALQSYAASIGYQHIIGGEGKILNLPKVLNIIKSMDLQLYKRLMMIKNNLKIK